MRLPFFHSRRRLDGMMLIASYFEPDKAAVAAEALRKAAIAFEQATRAEDGLESVELSVAEVDQDRAAAVIEELEELFARAEGRKPVVCARCGSSELAQDRTTGSFGEYEVLMCRKCDHVVVQRR